MKWVLKYSWSVCGAAAVISTVPSVSVPLKNKLIRHHCQEAPTIEILWSFVDDREKNQQKTLRILFVFGLIQLNRNQDKFPDVHSLVFPVSSCLIPSTSG